MLQHYTCWDIVTWQIMQHNNSHADWLVVARAPHQDPLACYNSLQTWTESLRLLCPLEQSCVWSVLSMSHPKTLSKIWRIRFWNASPVLLSSAQFRGSANTGRFQRLRQIPTRKKCWIEPYTEVQQQTCCGFCWRRCFSAEQSSEHSERQISRLWHWQCNNNTNVPTFQMLLQCEIGVPLQCEMGVPCECYKARHERQYGCCPESNSSSRQIASLLVKKKRSCGKRVYNQQLSWPLTAAVVP